MVAGIPRRKDRGVGRENHGGGVDAEVGRSRNQRKQTALTLFSNSKWDESRRNYVRCGTGAVKVAIKRGEKCRS